MKNKTYGYVRVSTKEQNENRQLDAMLKFGVAMEDITVEKISGKDFKRPLYTALVTRLQEGDVLVVESLDRFGRNYIEIQNQCQLLTNEKGVSIVVLDLDILDTRQTGDELQDLTTRLISDVALRLFSYVAELERRHIRQRQAEGIQAARERGVHMGRKPLKMTDSFPDLAEMWHKGEILKEFPSEALQSAYDAIYRTQEEYTSLFQPLLDAGFSIVEQYFLPEEVGRKRVETNGMCTILKR